MKRNLQPDLPGLADPRPCELVVNGSELAAVLAHVKAQGGFVGSMAIVPRHRAQYRLRITWLSGFNERSQNVTSSDTRSAQLAETPR